MKAILNLSITCMVAAGLYGFADFTSDLNDGHLIRYDEGNNAKLKEVSATNKIKLNKLAVRVNSEVDESNAVTNTAETTIDPDKLQLKYFSRGAPVFSEEELIVEDSAETVAAEQSAQALTPSNNPHE